jgi:hypothetical protein
MGRGIVVLLYLLALMVVGGQAYFCNSLRNIVLAFYERVARLYTGECLLSPSSTWYQLLVVGSDIRSTMDWLLAKIIAQKG